MRGYYLCTVGGAPSADGLLGLEGLNGPKGASSPAAQGRPSSRGTSAGQQLAGTRRSPGDMGITHEEPHGGAQARGHEAVQRAHRVDVDGVVGHVGVLGGAHGDGFEPVVGSAGRLVGCHGQRLTGRVRGGCNGVLDVVHRVAACAWPG